MLRLHLPIAQLRWCHVLSCFGIAALANDEAFAAGDQEPPAPAAWHEFAETAQPALLVCYWKHRQQVGAKAPSGGGVVGFFISEEGHALCGMLAFCAEARPELGNWERQLIPSWKLLALLPEENLAVVKLDYRPRKWLTLADHDAKLDEVVSFLVPGQLSPIHTGPVVARRMTWLAELPKLTFAPVLSIGTQPPRVTQVGGANLADGCPLIDRSGKVVGVFAKRVLDGQQTLLEAVPVGDLRAKVSAAIKAGGNIEVPLTDQDYPLDPSIRHPAYTAITLATRDGRLEDAIQSLRDLVKAFPRSAVVRNLQSDLLIGERHRDEFQEALQEMMKLGETGGLDPFVVGNGKARLAVGRADHDAAIRALEEWGTIIPQGFHQPAASLGGCYHEKAIRTGAQDDWLAAAKWYEKAIAASPDRLSLWTAYQAVLSHLRRWDELAQVEARIWKLEDCYRTR